MPEHCTLEWVNELVGFAVLKGPLACAADVLQFFDTAGTLERNGRLSSVGKMLSNKGPLSPTPTSPTTPSLTSSPSSAASVLTGVLSKEGTCEPSQLFFLGSSHGSISPKVVAKVCGGNAQHQVFVYHRCRCAGQRARRCDFTYLAARIFARLNYQGGEIHCSNFLSGSSCAAQGSVQGATTQPHAPRQVRLRQFAQWREICWLGCAQPRRASAGKDRTTFE